MTGSTAKPNGAFQFGLRSMFVALTLLAVLLTLLTWFGSNVHIVRERQRQMRVIAERGGFAISSNRLPKTPFLCNVFGDNSREIIELPEEQFTNEEAELVRSLWPEAIVMRIPQRDVRRNGNEREY